MTTEDPKTEIEVPKSRAPEPKPDARRQKLRKIGGLVVGFAAVGTVLAGLTGYWTTYRTVTKEILAPAKPAPVDAAHLSIVVLPFTNLSGDPSQDYFADGITENLTTDLSRIRNSFVIARNTAFTFKGRNIPVKEISKELGVRYVLEGSVQRDGNHVRVNAQLIDGQTGAHLWADRFEEEMVDVFKLQDQVVARLANTLGSELVKAEAEKSTHSGNPDAIDLTMRGWAILNQPFADKDSRAKALGLFEQALKLDPSNVDGLVGAALAEWSVSIVFGMEEKPGQIAKIEELLANAIRIDPTNARAYVVRGRTYHVTRRTKKPRKPRKTR